MERNLDVRKSNKKIMRFLSIIIFLLAILVAAIPSALTIMRRADAQVALGNAKSLRIALQAAATETYAAGRPFRDASGNGGVTEEVWTEVLMDSKVPGDFWVLQTNKSGYEVLRFWYQEGDFSVLYTAEPLTYEVYYQEAYIQTEN